MDPRSDSEYEGEDEGEDDDSITGLNSILNAIGVTDEDEDEGGDTIFINDEKIILNISGTTYGLSHAIETRINIRGNLCTLIHSVQDDGTSSITLHEIDANNKVHSRRITQRSNKKSNNLYFDYNMSPDGTKICVTDLKHVKIYDDSGRLLVTYPHRASGWMVDQITVSNNGKHVAILYIDCVVDSHRTFAIYGTRRAPITVQLDKKDNVHTCVFTEYKFIWHYDNDIFVDMHSVDIVNIVDDV